MLFKPIVALLAMVLVIVFVLLIWHLIRRASSGLRSRINESVYKAEYDAEDRQRQQAARIARESEVEQILAADRAEEDARWAQLERDDEDRDVPAPRKEP